MTAEDMKKFAEIKARLDEQASIHHEAIKRGDFIRMMWAGVITEGQWLAKQLAKAVGDPGKPQDAEPLPPKTAKKVKASKGRLASVAANKEWEVAATEPEAL